MNERPADLRGRWGIFVFWVGKGKACVILLSFPTLVGLILLVVLKDRFPLFGGAFFYFSQAAMVVLARLTTCAMR